jgi:hypothetical protein
MYPALFHLFSVLQAQQVAFCSRQPGRSVVWGWCVCCKHTVALALYCCTSASGTRSSQLTLASLTAHWPCWSHMAWLTTSQQWSMCTASWADHCHRCIHNPSLFAQKQYVLLVHLFQLLFAVRCVPARLVAFGTLVSSHLPVCCTVADASLLGCWQQHAVLTDELHLCRLLLLPPVQAPAAAPMPAPAAAPQQQQQQQQQPRPQAPAGQPPGAEAVLPTAPQSLTAQYKATLSSPVNAGRLTRL